MAVLKNYLINFVCIQKDTGDKKLRRKKNIFR